MGYYCFIPSINIHNFLAHIFNNNYSLLDPREFFVLTIINSLLGKFIYLSLIMISSFRTHYIINKCNKMKNKLKISLII